MAETPRGKKQADSEPFIGFTEECMNANGPLHWRSGPLILQGGVLSI